MARIIALTLILTFIFIDCHSQTEGENDSVKQETLIALRKWFKNPSISNNHLDPAIINTLKDSGRTERGLKEGYWIHYSLDTSLMGKQVELTLGDKKLPIDLSAILQKETGNYLHGKKNGIWTLYQCDELNPPFNWRRNTVTNYKNGLKDGEEMMYQGYVEEKPLLITHWKNGVAVGLMKTYYDQSPYELKKVYNNVGGQALLIAEYYSSGQLQKKYNDTTINGQKFRYCEEYFASGKLKMAGFLSSEQRSGIWKTFYENGKIESIANFAKDALNGDFKYFYDNGQLWTEQVYKHGNLMEVICNYNNEGKKNDPGSLKNGTGTVNIYDENGKLTETQYFANGQETKGNR